MVIYAPGSYSINSPLFQEILKKSKDFLDMLAFLTPAHKGWVYSRPLRGLVRGGGGHKACGCSIA